LQIQSRNTILEIFVDSEILARIKTEQNVACVLVTKTMTNISVAKRFNTKNDLPLSQKGVFGAVGIAN